MKGIYYYDLLKEQWKAYIEVNGVQVVSKTLKHKGLLKEFMDQNSFVKWEKA